MTSMNFKSIFTISLLQRTCKCKLFLDCFLRSELIVAKLRFLCCRLFIASRICDWHIIPLLSSSLSYFRINICRIEYQVCNRLITPWGLGQTDRQFIQTYTYSTSSQHKLYNEICHVYLHICEIKNEQISVSLTVTKEKKNIFHTQWPTRTY